MQRVLAALAVFPLSAFVLWLGGYDFDTRNFGVAWYFCLTLFVSVLTYSWPGWEK